MNNKTYSDLLGLIQALAGVDSFTTLEQVKILAIVNRRLYEAYRASPTWARYYFPAEARPIVDNIISRSYSVVGGTRTTSSATRLLKTVTIVCTASVDFVSEKNYSHSMVAGGLLLMSYTTRLIPFTLLMISLETSARNS